MQQRATIAATLALLALGIRAEDARAQSATQVVRFEVNPVSRIAVSGNPSPMTISTATAGSAPTSVTADGTSYAVTTNQSNQKITASLDQAMPNGVTLEISLAAPDGAASSGSIALGTAGADVVTGISVTSASSLPITYRLSASTAVVLPATSRTVTLTIVTGS